MRGTTLFFTHILNADHTWSIGPTQEVNSLIDCQDLTALGSVLCDSSLSYCSSLRTLKL